MKNLHSVSDQRGYDSNWTFTCASCGLDRDFFTGIKGPDGSSLQNSRAFLAELTSGGSGTSMVTREALCDRTCLSKTAFTNMMNGVMGEAIVEVAEDAMARQRDMCARLCWPDVPVVAGRRGLGAAMDGAWPKRGADSLCGIVDATCAKCNKVLDYEVLQKACGRCEFAARRIAKAKAAAEAAERGGCGICEDESGDGDAPPAPAVDIQDDEELPRHGGVCHINHVGSSKSMEAHGAQTLFRRAIMEHNIYYHLLVTDDDSDFAIKARKHVELVEEELREAPEIYCELDYEDSFPIEEQRDVGHGQGAAYKRLKALKAEHFKGSSHYMTGSEMSVAAHMLGQALITYSGPDIINMVEVQLMTRVALDHLVGRHHRCPERGTMFAGKAGWCNKAATARRMPPDGLEWEVARHVPGAWRGDSPTDYFWHRPKAVAAAGDGEDADESGDFFYGEDDDQDGGGGGGGATAHGGGLSGGGGIGDDDVGGVNPANPADVRVEDKDGGGGGGNGGNGGDDGDDGDAPTPTPGICTAPVPRLASDRLAAQPLPVASDASSPAPATAPGSDAEGDDGADGAGDGGGGGGGGRWFIFGVSGAGDEGAGVGGGGERIGEAVVAAAGAGAAGSGTGAAPARSLGPWPDGPPSWVAELWRRVSSGEEAAAVAAGAAAAAAAAATWWSSDSGMPNIAGLCAPVHACECGGSNGRRVKERWAEQTGALQERCQRFKAGWAPGASWAKAPGHAGHCKLFSAPGPANIRHAEKQRAKEGGKGIGLLDDHHILHSEVERLVLQPVFGHFSSASVVEKTYKVGRTLFFSGHFLFLTPDYQRG